MVDYQEAIEAANSLVGAVESFKAKYDARIEEIDQHLVRMNRPLTGGSDKRAGGDLLAERRSIGAFVKSGTPIETKGMEAGEGPLGGYVVLSAVSNSMTRRLWDSSPIRRLARIQNISTGDAWVEPIDRDQSAASWVGEREARPALDTPELGLLTIVLDEIYSSQVVTQKLLDLSYVDIGAWLEGKIADKFARTEAEAFLLGDGVGRPRGLLDYDIVSTADATRPANEIQYIASGSASDITGDSLRSIYWGLRAPYRGNSTWLMSSATASVVDKVKDGSGVYLWRPAMSVSEPPTLLGRPVEIDENMPAISGGSYPVLFGDFARAYIIVERHGLKLLRDPFSSKPSVVFYAYRRVGGGLGDCDALKVLKVATS